MSYKSSFISGLTWSGALKIATKAVSIVKLAILARLLSLQDIGLFSLVMVTISLVEVFTESGINTILIQTQKKIETFIDTAWIFSICRGFLIALIIVLLSFVLSNFYQEPALLNLILFASIIPLIRGFINPAIINFYKELDFKRDTYYRFTLVIVDFLTAIAAAFFIKNTFALIIPILVSALFDVFISFFFVRIKPKLKFDRDVFLEIFHQTKKLNNISILDYLNKNLDNLIIGKIMGTSSLGLYQNAYALTQSATSELSQPVIHASFPIYSRLFEDTARLKKAFTKVALIFCSALIIPTFLLILFPEFIVRLQFGEEWLGMVAFLPILAISGYIQGLFNIGSTVFTVRKKYFYLSSLLASTLISMVIGLLIFTPRFGLLGGAGSVLLSRLITLPLFFYLSLKTFKDTSNSKV